MDSPHCFQAIISGLFRKDCVFSRTMQRGFGTRVYQPRGDEMRTVVHWGQRKLLLVEIEFLTMFTDPRPGIGPKKVVYAGAAPGTHIHYLLVLFPYLTFDLHDPAPFSVRNSKYITTFQHLFTNEIAQQYSGDGPGKGQDVLFISDIRSADVYRQSANETDEAILNDLMRQQEWYKIIKPYRGHLKFRMPFAPGYTKHLDGDIYFQPWAPVSSTETRMVPYPNMAEKEFNHTLYEQQMYYFNSVYRPSWHWHRVVTNELDCCYDCMSEVIILREYLLKFRFGYLASPVITDPEIIRMSEAITTLLGKGKRKLMDGNIDATERYEMIKRRQWIDNRPAYEAAALLSQDL